MANQHKTITYEDLKEIANSKNGKVISSEYKNSNQLIEWECEFGHNFKLALKHIRYYGHWCKYCKNYRVKELICKEYFEQIFNKKFEKIRPDWLKFNKFNLELDGYCSELGLAFEHNGKQHYNFSKFFHANKQKFIEQKNRDLFKINKCLENNVKLIIIPELFELTKIKDLGLFIINEAKNLGFNNFNYNYNVDLSNINIINTKLNKYKEIAIKNGGECLSDVYCGFHNNLKWKCELGHVWETKGFLVEGGSWCPICKGLKKFSIEDVYKIAECKGECLSTKYVSANEKLLWKCSKNHIWETTLSSVKNRGTWCPVCLVPNLKISQRFNNEQKNYDFYVDLERNR